MAGCVKLRMVPSDAEPHDFVAADSTSGCMIFSPLKGVAQVHFERLSFIRSVDYAAYGTSERPRP